MNALVRLAPRVVSDYVPLRVVMVHGPGAERVSAVDRKQSTGDLLPGVRTLLRARKEFSAFRDLLRLELGESCVLELVPLLVEVFEPTDRELRAGLVREILHDRAATYIDYLTHRGIRLEHYPAARLVDDLIFGCPRKTSGDSYPLGTVIPPSRSLMWLRDAAATTPSGVIIHSMPCSHRRLEPTLVRAVLRHHRRFDARAIFLDILELSRSAAAADSTQNGWAHILEGGNIVVLDECTLAIGTLSSGGSIAEEAFRRLVECIFKYDTAERIEHIYRVFLCRSFPHLDSVFSMIGPQSAVAMPYVLGVRDFPSAPDLSWGIGAVREWALGRPVALRIDERSLPSSHDLERLGRVEIYSRDQFRRLGRASPLPDTPFFLDHLIRAGLLKREGIAWIGGFPEVHASPREHLKLALREQVNQAANILTLAPFQVVAYQGNEATLDAMEAVFAGRHPRLRVERIEGRIISTGYGGPRCLTMPLLRV